MLLILISLLALYILPLIIITITYVMSSSFTTPGSGVFFGYSIALTKIYLGPMRETLGTFVVPFITAYAVSSIQKGMGFERDTKIIFFLMVAAFLLAIIVYCMMDTGVNQLLAESMINDQTELKETRIKLLQMPESYIKETLAYISLLLGISHSKVEADK